MPPLLAPLIQLQPFEPRSSATSRSPPIGFNFSAVGGGLRYG